MPGSTNSTIPAKVRQLSLFFHLRKTARLLGSLMNDQRIAPWRKLAFIGIIGMLLLAMFVPELGADLTTLLIPGLNIIGVPVEVLGEGAVDWAVIVVAAFRLLTLFPADIVGEHYDHLFRGK